jgi:Cu/Ag efflux pump CusA
MLNTIIKFSLNNKYFVAVCGGPDGCRISHGKQYGCGCFPDLTAPTVVVMTDAHGMASEEVERLVTFPIETAMNGATDVRRVRSSSSQGFHLCGSNLIGEPIFLKPDRW